MDREIRRALLGDRAAQERLTEQGVLLPCPFCGENGMPRNFGGDGSKWVSCSACYCDDAIGDTKMDAIRNWNDRAPILSAEELERLEDGYGK